MTARRKKKSFLKSVTQKFFILIIVALGAFFLGANKDSLKDFYDESQPKISQSIASKTPKLKSFTKTSLSKIKNGTEAGLNRIKNIKRADVSTNRPTSSSKEPQISQEVSIPTNQGELKISSFNIRLFSNNSRDDSELKQIVGILKEYDLIAIQELRDERVMQRAVALLAQMGYHYNYDISPPVGRGVKERYAFLYLEDKVKVLKDGKVFPDKDDAFIREPYYATFKSGNFDFTLVTMHALFGDSKKDRRPEIVKLADVYQFIQDENNQEDDIILLGDFNFPPTDVGFNRLKSVPSMTPIIVSSKTTVTDTSLYDNFWFQKMHVTEYTGQSGINKFDEILFNNDDKKAKLAVSDHRPIWATFDVTGRDDD